MIKYSIVIPTLNEADNIVTLIQKIEGLGLADFEIIVVDENSPDGTAAKVNEYAASHHKDNIKAILNDGLPGLSPSIVKGFHAAKGEFLCCMDGDMQHDASALTGIFKMMESNDFVVGSRYTEGGGFKEKWNPARVFISRSATMMAHVILSVKVLDPMSGFFAIRKSVFEDVAPRMSPRGFKIMLELLYLVTHAPGRHYRVAEYGIIFGLRQHGKSKLSSKVIVDYLSMLVKLRLSKR